MSFMACGLRSRAGGNNTLAWLASLVTIELARAERLQPRLKTFAHRGLAGFDYSRRVAPRIVCMATIAM